jgi:uncharacterized membrane protein
MNQNTTIVSGATTTDVDPSLVTYTHVIYALHALTVLSGIFTSATIVLSFVVGIPSIIAVIMNYARRSAVTGTWLESHFRWQIRTFWWAAGGTLAVALISAPFVLILIGFVMWWIGAAVIGIWLIYRVVRGWIALRDRKPMYV